MRLVDADLLLEKWNNMSKKDRTRFDQVILCPTYSGCGCFL